MNQNTFLEGEKILLRPLEEEDAEGSYQQWFNDPEVCKFNSHHRFPKTKEELKTYIKKTRENKKELVLAIVEKTTRKHIGNASLAKINWIDRNAEITIIIGEKEAWGKGYASETWRLMITHGFKTLNLHRIWCGFHQNNISMQKVAEKVGMREEGRLKDETFKDGKYFDIIRYAILKEAFSAKA